jgi:sugar phosphate permease
MAVGVLVAGSSLAGATLPVAISPLVNDPAYGWRFGFGVLAVAFWLLAVLPAFLVLREAPATASATDTQASQALEGVTFAEALRSRTLWCLAVGSACLWFAIQALTSQITIYFEQEAGLAPQRATALYSTILACSVAGKFLFGAVSDRFRKQPVMVVTSLTLLAGCLLLFTSGGAGLGQGLELARSPVQLTAFAVIFGLGFGGSFTLIQLVAVESFGQLALGRILGVVIFVDTMGGAAGTLLAGQIRTATGDYFLPFALVTVVAVIAVGNVLLIRPVARITNA